MRALIVGNGYALGSLAATRALAQAGWTVGIGSPEPGLAGASRWSHRAFRVPSPVKALDGFLEAVNEATRKERYEVVFGGGDAEVLALSAWRDCLQPIVPYAEHDLLVRAIDKMQLSQAAESVGLHIPKSVAANEKTLSEIDGPVLVKSRMHWTPGMEGSPDRLEAKLVSGRAEAAERTAAIRAAGGEPILQEFIEGRFIAYIAYVCRSGEIAAYLQQDAPSKWPVDTGVTARAQSVTPDPGLAENAAKLFRELGWFGIAQLQLLVPTDGVPRLIDLNGRFYIPLALATDSGLNLPAMWACEATGRPPPLAIPIPPGRRWQWLEGDLRRALVERRGGATRDLVDTLLFGCKAIHTVQTTKDPRTMFRYVVNIPRRALRRCGASDSLGQSAVHIGSFPRYKT